ncbi:MAG: ornithine--oxo-acid transaminase [Saprospiraceae bacterium]
MISISKLSQKEYIQLEEDYGAHNYHPIPVVLERGSGIYLYDTDGKCYFDFLSAYSAVNQGHSHPRIIHALIQQAQKLTLCSRAFHNSMLGQYEQFMNEYFGYDKLLPMNTGVEAVETAIKLCRKWSYEVKGVEEHCAEIIVVEGNFHGRTIAAVSISTDPSSYSGYGPFLGGIIKVPYNDIEAFRRAAERPNVGGFLLEPIQGEAGVIIPEDDYLKEAFSICKEKNILFIADEVQTGIARTGKLLACDHVNIRPDILILGKALSGGVLPVSAVLADNEIMLCVKPGEHGSTFGGNPLACAVTMEALKIVKDEQLEMNAMIMGNYLKDMLNNLKSKFSMIKEIRGRGLLIAIELNNNSEEAWNLCLKLAENGLLAKPTHGNIIRLAPPLIINKEQLETAVGIIEKSLRHI